MKKTNQISGTLYIVSTSIGNKKDITIRATEVLQNCDIIVGEEMKEASRVLMHLNLSKPIELLNEHNEKEKVGELIELLKNGKSIALISDCGTPIFADPGIELLRTALSKEIEISVIPGASSIMTAMVRSGFDLKRFFYAGFLHRNSKERIKEITDLSSFPYTIIVMDTPYRLKVLLEDFAEVMPQRKAYIGMNLTMQSETHHYGTFAELYEKFKSTRTRNEYVLIIEGNLIGNISSVRDTFEIDNKIINFSPTTEENILDSTDDEAFEISAKEIDIDNDFDNELLEKDLSNKNYDLVQGDEDLVLDNETESDKVIEHKGRKEQRNQEDNRRLDTKNRNESNDRERRRDDSRRGGGNSESRRSERRSDDRRNEGRRDDSQGRYRRDDDRRSASRRDDSRPRYRRDDDRQDNRSNDGGRDRNERRGDNFRDGYRRRNDDYQKDDRPRREQEDGGFRRSNDSKDSGRRRNDDFRQNDRPRGGDYGKEDRGRRNDFKKDESRGSRDRFDQRPKSQDDFGTKKERNYEEKRERSDRSENYESRDRREKRSYDDRSQSRGGDRRSNRGNRSDRSFKSERRPRRKKD